MRPGCTWTAGRSHHWSARAPWFHLSRLALNVSNDPEPFRRINPCGHAGLEVTSTRQLGIDDDTDLLARELSQRLADARIAHQQRLNHPRGSSRTVSRANPDVPGKLNLARIV